MPLRLGSAGLKYPLPNKAETQARQNAAAASAGGSASASAYSANRRYAGLKKELRYKSLEAGLDRGFKAQQSFFDREHQKGSQLSRQEAQDALQEKRITSQEGIAKAGREATKARQTQRHKYGTDTDKLKRDQDREDIERRIDADIEDRLRRGDLVLTPSQSAKLAELEQEKEDGEFLHSNPEMQAEGTRKYKARRRAILRGHQQSMEPTAVDLARKRTLYRNPQTGELSNTDGAKEGEEPWEARVQLKDGTTVPRDQDPVKAAQVQKSRDERTKTEAGLAARANEIVKRISSGDANDQGSPEENYAWAYAQAIIELKHREEQRSAWGNRTAVPGGAPPTEGPDGTMPQPGPVPDDPSGTMPPAPLGQPPTDEQDVGAVPADQVETTVPPPPEIQELTRRIEDIMEELGVTDISEIEDPELMKEVDLLERKFNAWQFGEPIQLKADDDPSAFTPGTRVRHPTDGTVREIQPARAVKPPPAPAREAKPKPQVPARAVKPEPDALTDEEWDQRDRDLYGPTDEKDTDADLEWIEKLRREDRESRLQRARKKNRDDRRIKNRLGDGRAYGRRGKYGK